MTNCSIESSFEQEIINQMYQRDVWKNISGSDEIIWTLELLIKYEDKIDWKELSKNIEIEWTVEIIEHFKTKLDFKKLSISMFQRSYRINKKDNILVIRKYPDLFDWSELSKYELPIYNNVIDEFLTYWDWEELIDNHNVHWTKKMYKKYFFYLRHISLSTITDSRLWYNIVEIEQKKIDYQIITENECHSAKRCQRYE